MKVYKVNAQETFGDNNNGYQFGVQWDDNNGNNIDIQWFKSKGWQTRVFNELVKG
jgi:hypothetical protein